MNVVTDEEWALMVKRYEDAGDQVNADIIRKQWELARAGAGQAHSRAHGGAEQASRAAETGMAAMPHGGGEVGADRNAVLEQAAQIAENYGPRRPIVSRNPGALIQGRWEGEQAASTNIAAAIRAAATLPYLPTPSARHDDARQLVVIGGQRLGKSALMDLQHDAARYRWLRDKADKMGGTAAPMVASLDAAGRMVALLDGEDLDAAVDVAMAKRTVRRAVNTKREDAP